MSSKCRYCGQDAHGTGCFYSPTGVHKATGDPEHCIMCGSTAYGTGCYYAENNNPRKVHIHGHGKGTDGKVHCIYCGVTIPDGSACFYSPTGKHEG